MEQRAGRIIRQGNTNPEVNIFRYVTESTFDAYLYQTIENKQKFISQIMSSKSPVRSCEDVDETALSYAEIKALCAGNPMIKEKMDLDIEVARLKLLKSDHQNQHYRLEDNILKYFPMQIEKSKEHIEGFQKDISRLAENTQLIPDGISPMVVVGKTYTDRGEAGAAILEACKKIVNSEPTKVGSYRGFNMQLAFRLGKYELYLKGAMTYTTELGADTFGNITRINNALGEMPNRLKSAEAQLENFQNQLKNAEEELKNPFPFESELAEKSERLAILDSELNMDKGGDVPVAEEETDKSERVSAKAKPSILEALKKKSAETLIQKEKSDKPPAVTL